MQRRISSWAGPVAALVFLASLSAPATARPRPAKKPASRFEANKTFGLGLMLGVPSGISGKYYLAPSRALDFGIGGIGYYRGRDGLHLHADYLFHPAVLTRNPDFEVPLYVGIGGRFFSFTDNDDDTGAAIGLRLPIGISLDFNNVPLDLFFEIALVADVVMNYRDNYYADLTAALGVRYYFK